MKKRYNSVPQNIKDGRIRLQIKNKIQKDCTSSRILWFLLRKSAITTRKFEIGLCYSDVQRHSNDKRNIFLSYYPWGKKKHGYNLRN